LPMPLRRTRAVTFVEPLPKPKKTLRQSPKEPAPLRLRIVLNAKTGKRRASRSPRVIRKQPRCHPSHVPRVVRVHNRFLDSLTRKAVWQATVQRGDRKLLEHLTERQAQAMISAQVRRGFDHPEFEIARLGPRVSFHGVPQPGEERRYVFWKGFDKPSLMLEKDLPMSLLL